MVNKLHLQNTYKLINKTAIQCPLIHLFTPKLQTYTQWVSAPMRGAASSATGSSLGLSFLPKDATTH